MPNEHFFVDVLCRSQFIGPLHLAHGLLEGLTAGHDGHPLDGGPVVAGGMADINVLLAFAPDE